MSGLVPQLVKTVLEEFTFKSLASIPIDNSHVLNSPRILARWNITNTLSSQNHLVAVGATLTAVGEVLTGGGSINLAWATSTDNGTTWNNNINNVFSGVESAEDSGGANVDLGKDITDIAVILFGSGANTGTFKGLSAFLNSDVPEGLKLVKVL